MQLVQEMYSSWKISILQWLILALVCRVTMEVWLLYTIFTYPRQADNLFFRNLILQHSLEGTPCIMDSYQDCTDFPTTDLEKWAVTLSWVFSLRWSVCNFHLKYIRNSKHIIRGHYLIMRVWRELQLVLAKAIHLHQIHQSLCICDFLISWKMKYSNDFFLFDTIFLPTY